MSAAVRLLVAVSVAALLAACGEAEPRPEQAPAAAAPEPAGTAPNPPAAAGSGAAATDLPNDLPRYPGAEVLQIGGRGAMRSAIFKTTDGPDQVVSFLTDALATQGWSAQESSVAGERTVLADKGNRFLTIMVLPEEPGTKIGILLVER